MKSSPAVNPTWFLGPKAENQDLLTELIRAALEEHVAWRRAFHPADPSPIASNLKRSGFARDAARMRELFRALLEDLRASVPSFHGRYNGHMLSEQTIASQAAYFAAMLYDPNNVSPEVSPVTTRLEGEVATQLARMVGYDPATFWGHLTSGGTLANFEALWIARNVLYQPVAVALAARDLGIALRATLPDGARSNIGDLGLWELLNLTPSASLDLSEQLWASASRSDVVSTLRKYSLAGVGYQDYSRSLATAFGDPLQPGVVLASAAGHYSWEKILRALGVGSNQLVLVPVDARCRMDSQALWETVKSLTDGRTPIMACVAVCGTTEEGAIDPIDEVLAVRSKAERKLGVTFHVHADACYGGYAASVTRGTDGSRLEAADIRTALGCESWPSERIVESVRALEGTDSIAIDPHKLGYVPYPAGAFLLKDKRGRELVAVDPPYLALSGSARTEEPVIGRFIFEGSKPGAAAAAVWMSHTAIPLDVSGHGRIIGATARAAHRLHEELGRTDFGPFTIVRLPEPDLNIVCFLFAHAQLSVEETNSLNEAIYDQLSPGGEAASDYFVTRTRLTSPAYDGAIPRLLTALGRSAEGYWREYGATQGIAVLRATIMNPFASEREPDHVAGLLEALRHAAHRASASLIGRNGAPNERGFRPSSNRTKASGYGMPTACSTHGPV